MTKPTRALGHYRITYRSGSIQDKYLISHDDYVHLIKPKQELLKSINGIKALDIHKELQKMFGDSWFTDKSPIWFAYSRKVMKLLERKVGDYIHKIEKI